MPVEQTPPHAPQLLLNRSHLGYVPTPRVVTLNVNSLSQYTTTVGGTNRRLRIHSLLERIMRDNDIVCLQETHLTEYEDTALKSTLKGWKLFYNNGGERVSGRRRDGVLTAVSPHVQQHYVVSDTAERVGDTAKGHVLTTLFLPTNTCQAPERSTNIFTIFEYC